MVSLFLYICVTINPAKKIRIIPAGVNSGITLVPIISILVVSFGITKISASFAETRFQLLVAWTKDTRKKDSSLSCKRV
jgi:hypothetical protein